jgi:hypothetical protein
MFGSIGEPFGQKEDLINRIKKILNEYSSKISIFKGNFMKIKTISASSLQLLG